MRKNLLLEPNTTIDVILDQVPKLAEVFNASGLACVGCVFSRFHTLVDAAAAYKLDVDTFIGNLALMYDKVILPEADNT
jgi:hybrid cluster-associated redox disulfide protein